MRDNHNFIQSFLFMHKIIWKYHKVKLFSKCCFELDARDNPQRLFFHEKIVFSEPKSFPKHWLSPDVISGSWFRSLTIFICPPQEILSNVLFQILTIFSFTKLWKRASLCLISICSLNFILGPIDEVALEYIFSQLSIKVWRRSPIFSTRVMTTYVDPLC